MRRVPKGNRWTILMHACARGEDVHADNSPSVREKCVKIVLEKLKSPTFLNMQSLTSEDTALHLASRSGFGNIVTLLLAQIGINTSLKNAEGQTAYDVAATIEVKKVSGIVLFFFVVFFVHLFFFVICHLSFDRDLRMRRSCQLCMQRRRRWQR